MSSLPKAILYYSSPSVWSSAVQLTLEEKGYGPDEIEKKFVELKKGENFAPGYLRINPNGTVPSLVVPLESSLVPNAPKKFRALHDIKAILEFLDKSRLAFSKTHTTSLAPAPALAPATVSLAAIANRIMAFLNAVPVDVLYYGAVNAEELLHKARGPEVEFMKNNYAAIQGYMAEEADIVRQLWETKLLELEILIQIYDASEKPIAQLTAEETEQRKVFFEKSVNAWTTVRDILVRLEKEMEGPYTLGDQLSLIDLYLVAWITHLFYLAGAPMPPIERTPNALDPYANLENFIRSHAGDESFTLGPKVREFWGATKDRDSWEKVYGEGLR